MLINGKNLRRLVMTALLAALVTVFTAFIGHIPLPGATGEYLHFGDSLIYLAACLLPGPCAVLAGALGAGLADLLTSAVYAIPTVIIKTCIALCFSAKREKILCPRNALALLPAAGITLGGYFLASCVLTNWRAALLTLPFNLLQAAGSAAVFVLLALAMDRAGLKKRI